VYLSLPPMTAFWFALASAFFYALRTVALKASMDRAADAAATSVLFHLLGVLVCALIFPWPHISQVSAVSIMLIISNGILYSAVGYCEIKAYQTLDPSFAEVFGAVGAVLAALAGTLVFSESITWLQGAGLLLVSAAVRCTANFKACRMNRGVLLKLTSVLLCSIAMAVDKQLALTVERSLLMFSGYLLPVVFPLLTRPGIARRIHPIVRRCPAAALLAPLFSVGSYYCFLSALAQGQLSTVFPLLQTAMIFIFAFEILFLGLRENILQKTLACSLCLTGAAMLGVPG